MAATPLPVPYGRAIEAFPYLRQSLLSDFDNCPLSAHFGLAYEQGWSSKPAARGTIVHRAIARTLELMEENEQERPEVDVVIDDVLPEVIRQAEAPLEGPGGVEVVAVGLAEIAQARISLKAWAGNYRASVALFAGIEKRLNAVVEYPDGAGGVVKRVITGQLDLLLIDDVHAIVLDWKDTFGIPPESSISEEGYFQQRQYGLEVFENYPRIQRVTLREFYVRYASGKVLDRRGRAINPVREATIDRIALPELKGEFAALVERFDRSQEAFLTARREKGEKVAAFERRRRSHAFKPSPGSHCGYCPRADACPIFPSARVEGRITNRIEAELVASRINVAEGYLKTARKAMRSWANIHGDTDVKDAKRPRVYGPVVRVVQEKPDLETIKGALAAGRPVEELYDAHERVEFGMHSPEEEHPFAKAAREEEEMLLAAERERDAREARRQRRKR